MSIITIDPAKATAKALADYGKAVQQMVEDTATSRGYHDAVTLASYTVSTNPAWAAEAAAFVAWRDYVWARVDTELAKVQNGTRTQPSVAEFIAEFTPITWPQ